eukprot:TRINITY_DN80688_c0_g1_i1.p1 TRINITY_DN80688_c0_g1~~TRINITY_DN80688_c0_g1_i1.p1  ORF type:complete len:138 (-),score=17.56 TRINITY_DN80688_c0_g1_i1:131-544(-)
MSAMAGVHKDDRKSEQMPSKERRCDIPYSMSEVCKHCTMEDGWIVVRGKVYDITNFIKHHPGWMHAGQTSTILAIQRNLGKECTEEFTEIHSKNAWRQLDSYMIGCICLNLDQAPLRSGQGCVEQTVPAVQVVSVSN